MIYIQTNKNGLPYNMNTQAAMLGIEQMGFETKLFFNPEELADATLEDIVVGGVG